MHVHGRTTTSIAQPISEPCVTYDGASVAFRYVTPVLNFKIQSCHYSLLATEPNHARTTQPAPESVEFPRRRPVLQRQHWHKARHGHPAGIATQLITIIVTSNPACCFEARDLVCPSRMYCIWHSADRERRGFFPRQAKTSQGIQCQINNRPAYKNGTH